MQKSEAVQPKGSEEGDMRKSELKNFVQIYAEIKNALIKRSDVVEIIKRNRKVRVKIKPWMYKFPEFLNLVGKIGKSYGKRNYTTQH